MPVHEVILVCYPDRDTKYHRWPSLLKTAFADALEPQGCMLYEDMSVI